MKEIHFRFMILFDVMHKIAHNSNNECSELNWKHVNWCENEKLSTIFALIFAHWNSSELRNEWFHWQFCVLTFCSLTLFWKISDIIEMKFMEKFSQNRYNFETKFKTISTSCLLNKSFSTIEYFPENVDCWCEASGKEILLNKSYFMLYVMIYIYHLYFNVFLLFICFLRIFVTIKSMTNDKKGTWFVISNLK